MTASPLEDALRACALEADVALLISNGTPMAAIDWDGAIDALQAGELPCSVERRILMLSASLASGILINFGDAASGLDDTNTGRLVTAVWHASGKRL